MKMIKKVGVTPIESNTGSIIDSHSTLDDKTKNTYSMQVIDNLQNTLDTKVSKKPYYFNSVAAMKAYNLAEGDYVITKGYYSTNDGGGAKYEIVNDSNLVDDGSFIHNISGSIYAKLLIKDNEVNIRQLGAKSLDATLVKYDIKNDILKYIDYLSTASNRVRLYIPSGVWFCSECNITRSEGFYIYGDEAFNLVKDCGTIISTYNDNQDHIFQFGDATHPIYSWVLKNICFTSGEFTYNSTTNQFAVNYNNIKTVTGQILYFFNSRFGITDNLYFIAIKGQCIAMRNVWECDFRTLNFREISNYNSAVMEFKEKDASVTLNPNITACRFDNLMFESIHGDCIKFDIRCAFGNCVFNNINFEDYALSWDGASNTTFTPEILDNFDETTAIHQSIFNMEGSAEFALNNLYINNIGFRYSEFNNEQYVYDTIFNITGNYVELGCNINNINIVGMLKDCRIIKQDAQYIDNGMDNEFNINNIILNESSYDLYFDVNGYKNINTNAKLKSRRTGNNPFENSLIPSYKAFYNNASSTRGNLYYDKNAINPLNLVVKLNNGDMRLIPANKVTIVSDECIFRIKVPNEETATLSLITDAEHYKKLNITGDGNYHYYTMSGLLTTFNFGDVVEVRLGGETPNANVYLDVYKFTNSEPTIPTKTSDLTNDSGFITNSDLPTNYVTTNTQQNITGEKTFTGEKKIKFKQGKANDKCGFTIYDNSNQEIGYLEGAGNHTTPSMRLGVYDYEASSPILGFEGLWRAHANNEKWSRLWLYVPPKFADSNGIVDEASNTRYLPLDFTNGTNHVQTDISGTVNVSSLLPTKTSDLTNDSGFITNTAIPAIADNLTTNDATKTLSAKQGKRLGDSIVLLTNSINGMQETLVSGENIKTINNQSLLGSGNITIEGGGSSTIQDISADTELKDLASGTYVAEYDLTLSALTYYDDSDTTNNKYEEISVSKGDIIMVSRANGTQHHGYVVGDKYKIINIDKDRYLELTQFTDDNTVLEWDKKIVGGASFTYTNGVLSIVAPSTF